jgi:uncharacterized protein YbbC (DUF1343 family)
MFQGIDTMVIDLRDIGTRFYTYMTTTAYVLEEAAKRNFRRRPRSPESDRRLPDRGANPRQAALSFVGYFPMPIRHGMTLGEPGEALQR